MLASTKNGERPPWRSRVSQVADVQYGSGGWTEPALPRGSLSYMSPQRGFCAHFSIIVWVHFKASRKAKTTCIFLSQQFQTRTLVICVKAGLALYISLHISITYTSLIKEYLERDCTPEGLECETHHHHRCENSRPEYNLPLSECTHQSYNEVYGHVKHPEKQVHPTPLVVII